MGYDEKLIHDPTAGMVRLLEIMRALRDPEHGCPWDIEQDFSSIAPYTIEEAYEVADAIEQQNWTGLKSELGDLLCDYPKESSNNLALKVGSMQVIEITQKCFVEDRVLEQSITLNQTRQLVGLKFYVHPERLPVTIRYGKIKESPKYSR